MNSESLLVLIAITGGIAVTLQGQFMGQMDRQIGTIESVFITYAIGSLIAASIMIYLKGGQLATAFSAVPSYTFSAGILGLIIIGSIGYTVPRLGVASAFTVILVSQFTVAVLIDHFGLFGSEVRSMNLQKLSGIAVMIIGAYFATR